MTGLAAALLVALTGSAVFAGWIWDVPILKTIRPGFAAMSVLTAVSFVLAGLTLAARWTPWGRRTTIGGGIVVLLLGLAALIDLAMSGGAGHLNGFLTETIIGAAPLPPTTGVAPATAAAFVLLGLSIALVDLPHRVARRVVGWATSAGLLISGLAVVGYAYGVPALYAVSPFTAMALHTAGCFVLLFASSLLAHPEWGWVRVLASRASGGTMARRIVPLVILLPAAIGYLALAAVLSGFFLPNFAFALVAIVTIIPMAALICRYGSLLDRLEAEELRADARMRRRQSTLEREVSRHAKAIAADAAEHLKVERALREAQKAEAIGQLTGGVAHEFNNLLTAIIGNLELMQKASADDGGTARFAAAGLRAAERGVRLTQQLLVFSRRQVLKPESVKLNDVITEFEPMLRQAIGAGVELVTRLRASPGVAYLDVAQFESAILNLVVNARDALLGAGLIVIETNNAELGQGDVADNPDLQPGPYIMVAVTDNGHGMSADVLARVFDPFFTTKDVGKGTGLGLSQVQGFAKESRGHVALCSEVGSGTTVRLYLPCHADFRPATAVASPPVPRAHAPNKETVLVVEDDQAVRETAVEILIGLGYRVLVARDGKTGRAMLEAEQGIDILFSDVVMPGGMTGIQLAAEGRRLRPKLKVLLTSGYAREALTLQHRLEKDMPLLPKPYRRDELAQELDLLEGAN